MDSLSVGRILAIALRTGVRKPMQEVEQAFAREADGLEGDMPEKTRERGLTLLSAPQWQAVNAELEADLPWHTRRANVLVDAASLGHLIGKNVQVGGVRVRIHAETTPCKLMDELHDGLRKVLEPDCRGGVYGEVLSDGTVEVGQAVCIVE